MIKIGWWLSEAKQRKFDWPAVLDAFAAHKISQVKLDAKTTTVEEFQSLDCILHRAYGPDPSAVEMREWLQQMLAAPGCPAIPVIDPIEAADSLLHRERYFARLSEAIENHHPGTCQWTIPNSATIKTAGTPKADNVDALRVQLASSHVKLPVVCKFVGLTTDAHQMAIASTVAGLAEFVAEAPVGSTIVAQQFVNHGGVLHKIFVIGSAVHDVQRKSIRDLSDKDTETGLVRFDSSTISKATSTSPLHQAAAAAATTTATTTARSISVNTLQRLAQEVGDCLQLSLFGIDVVIDSDTGENVVIDVNYFPGYVGMPNVPEHVVRLVEARCRK